MEMKMDKHKLRSIQSALGVDLTDSIEYHLPRPDEDVLDTASNLMAYARAKDILESEEVNPILRNLNAFDSINIFDIDSYTSLSESVKVAIDNFTKFQNGEDYNDDLDLIGSEIFIEYTANAYAANNSIDTQADSGMDVDSKPMDMGQDEAKKSSWFVKLARKLGFKDIDFKDMLYLYLINKYNHRDDDSDLRPQSMHGSMPPMREAQESALKVLVEDTPLELKAWTRAVERAFMVEYPENWRDVILASALDKLGTHAPSVVTEADDATIGVDDGRTGPKMSATVKSDVNKRIKELNNLIKDYDSKEHFYGEKKPAIFNARDSLTYIMDKCKSGTLTDYKLAQIHLQKLMSPITNLFPPSLIRFLATGTDKPESNFNNPVS